MASNLFSGIQEFVAREWERIDRDHLSPWLTCNGDEPFQSVDFSGEAIVVQPHGFADQRTRFWIGYIDPFLRDVVVRTIAYTVERAPQDPVKASGPLSETSRQLKAFGRRAYARMVEIDHALTGSPHLYKASTEIEVMDHFIDRAIRDGMEALSPEPEPVDSRPWVWAGIAAVILIVIVAAIAMSRTR